MRRLPISAPFRKIRFLGFSVISWIRDNEEEKEKRRLRLGIRQRPDTCRYRRYESVNKETAVESDGGREKESQE
jgi:hypothetical protein